MLLVVVALTCPRLALAQQAAVARVLTDLRTVLEGSYGDEGAEVARLLDALAEAGASAERSVRDAEQRVRALAGDTSPGDAAIAHELLGAAYVERGRFAEAIAALDDAIRLAPARVSLSLSRALAFEAMGSPDRAAIAFREAWTIDPDNPATAYLALTRSAIDGANLTRARDTLLRAARSAIAGVRPGTPMPFPQVAAMAPAAGGDPLFPPARYADGFARALRGAIPEGLARLRNVTAGDPLIAAAASRQGAEALRTGTLRAARAAFEQAAKASPRSSEAHRMLAVAAALAGDVRASIEHFETAIRISPDDERTWLALAGVHADAGAIGDAVRVLEQAVAAVPASGELAWRLAGLLMRVDRSGDALERYSDAARATPIAGGALVLRAVVSLASLQQDLPRAREAAERWVRASLNDASAHRELASVRTNEGRQDEAFAELAIAAWLDPADTLTLAALGQALMADRRDDEAVGALERAVMLQPELREARYALAQALMRASRRDEARRHLAEFDRQRAEATAREQRALDIAAVKTDAAARSAAGQHAQAVGLRRRVIALEPGVAANYLDLAEALVKAGALGESVQYYVKTADMDGVAEVHLRLADVLGRLGRAKESAVARETYERLRLEDFRRRTRP